MADQEIWYYSHDGQDRQGPISWGKIQEYFKGGILSPETMIWAPHLPEWTPAKRLIAAKPRMGKFLKATIISAGVIAGIAALGGAASAIKSVFQGNSPTRELTMPIANFCDRYNFELEQIINKNYADKRSSENMMSANFNSAPQVAENLASYIGTIHNATIALKTLKANPNAKINSLGFQKICNAPEGGYSIYLKHSGEHDEYVDEIMLEYTPNEAIGEYLGAKQIQIITKLVFKNVSHRSIKELLEFLPLKDFDKRLFGSSLKIIHDAGIEYENGPSANVQGVLIQFVSTMGKTKYYNFKFKSPKPSNKAIDLSNSQDRVQTTPASTHVPSSGDQTQGFGVDSSLNSSKIIQREFTLQSTHSLLVAAWLQVHPGYRIAKESDCAGGVKHIQSIRRGFGDAQKPDPDYQPYYTVGDFNNDGQEDFAVAIIAEAPGPKRFLLLVFNGPFSNPQSYKPAFISEREDFSDQGFFFGPPRSKPYRLLVGGFASSGVFLLPKGNSYEWEKPSGDD